MLYGELIDDLGAGGEQEIVLQQDGRRNMNRGERPA
jgi:hypothetical protein